MYNPAKTTVLLARFEDIFLRGLEDLVTSSDNLELTRTGVATDQLSTELNLWRPTIALLNLAQLHSALQIRELALAYPSTRLLVIADALSAVEASQLMAFGAAGCLARQTQARDILHAIHLASRGLQISPALQHDQAAQHEGFQSLTPREADVLALLQTGRSNSEIALQLHVGIETVRTHARNIYRKLGVQSRRQLKQPV